MPCIPYFKSVGIHNNHFMDGFIDVLWLTTNILLANVSSTFEQLHTLDVGETHLVSILELVLCVW